MNKCKICFILSSIHDTHCYKRINEFISRGFEVLVYGYERNYNDLFPSNLSYEVNILGKVENSRRFLNRFNVIYTSLKEVLSTTDGLLHYFFGFDVAFLGTRILGVKDYIYEECDLVQTYFPFYIAKPIDLLNKQIINKSLATVFTSEGFIKYYFKKGKAPENVFILPNKLDESILTETYESPQFNFDFDNITFGFVGRARFESIYNFARTIGERYPQHSFVFFGDPMEDCFNQLTKYKNISFKGPFKNPTDLPHIYSSFDLLVTTYDQRIPNVRYAEPNKLYEAIYFEKPIIVSRGTFLEDRVSSLDIGYSMDALQPDEIIEFISSLNLNSVKSKIKNSRKISKSSLINNNKIFIDFVEKIII